MFEHYNRRYAWFFLFWLVSLAPFWTSVSALAALSTQDDRYSYVILMPLISLGLIILQKRSIFAEPRYCAGWGIALLVTGSMLYVAARRLESGLTVEILAVVLVWMAGFLIVYGTRAFRAAAVPMFALLLTSPLPQKLMHMAEVGLQYASADVSHAVFKVIGIPVFRNGLVFALPGLNIEVAEQCSGPAHYGGLGQPPVLPFQLEQARLDRAHNPHRHFQERGAHHHAFLARRPRVTRRSGGAVASDGRTTIHTGCHRHPGTAVPAIPAA
jgi:Transmembrane exosortase (Exosortase_EpsH)